VLETIDGLPAGCLGMRVVGVFTTENFVEFIEPRVAEIVEHHAQLRLLLHFGPAFTGFGQGAWGQLTSGIRHIQFHRGAVVTDDGNVRNALNLLKFALHGQVRTFQNVEYDHAVDWLTK
jgi:SpoIIAA-like